ncbi:hypothetical protein [Lysinibacillus sp. G4S2]|uniref:hypothetical protein n=1 Tax=Lysinibacillus sp. G4S2 TaxID=3055859 RepID=UPI0025A30FF5|nr:hypothetical protein [Lysinibacillus sp. G4S2]MDM5250759.1 hypothetical protein [Lysinibacillus sp. G4S2]
MRKRSVSGKCFSCAKAKRQQQSAQSERKSTTRYGMSLLFKFAPSIINIYRLSTISSGNHLLIRTRL